MIYYPNITLGLSRKTLLDQAMSDSMRRILVVNNGSMLDEGVVMLLRAREGLDVLSIDSFEGEDALVRCIESTHPEVVIINRESSINPARLFEWVEGAPRFTHLQIVMIRVDSNMMEIYENKQISELHNRDFFDFLQGAPIK